MPVNVFGAVLVVICAVGSGVDVSVTSSLSFDVAAAKNRPVSKVVTLLKDMLKQLEKEMEEDEAIYDKIACWCETNDKEKTKAIKDAEEKIGILVGKIEEYTAWAARLTTEINHLKVEIKKYHESLNTATSLRKKELAEFNAEEKDMLESIAALKSAVKVLGKHHGGSLLQAVSADHLLGVAKVLGHELEHHADLLKGVLTHTQVRKAAAFVQAPADYFDGPPASKKSNNAASGEIFGILSQMLETFESNLASAQKDEMASQKSYEELKLSIESEIDAATPLRDTKVVQLAEVEEKLAMWKEDLDDTRNTLSADEKFLLMLKEKCQMTDKEWEARQKMRAMEMEAITKAMSVLSSDDAMDTSSSTFSFLQREGSSDKVLRSQASELLKATARKLDSPRLLAIATQVRIDAFTKVKAAIDDLIMQLTKEGADEIKHKDFCVDDFNTNQLQTEKKEREKSDLEAKIEDLKMTIEQLTKEIAALKAAIAEMQLQVKRAGEDREKENNNFQLTIADQRATQKLLQEAMNVLKGFYDPDLLQTKKKDPSLDTVLAQDMQGVAVQAPAGPAPPPGFKKYKKQGAAGGVMGLIQQIINDAKAMEADAIKDEDDAQKAYGEFVTVTNASIEEAAKEIVNKSESKAKAEADLVEAEGALSGVVLELDELSSYNSQLHASCDYVLKNFEIRQTARSEEIDALKQAKAILSGAKFEAFLQGGDDALVNLIHAKK